MSILVAQDLIDLRILDGAAVAAPDARLPHLSDQIGKPPAIQGGVVTYDIALGRDGSYDPEQIAALAAICS